MPFFLPGMACKTRGGNTLMVERFEHDDKIIMCSDGKNRWSGKPGSKWESLAGKRMPSDDDDDDDTDLMWPPINIEEFPELMPKPYQNAGIYEAIF